MTSTITYVGEIFEKNAWGQVVPRNEGEMITRERAIELGLEYLRVCDGPGHHRV